MSTDIIIRSDTFLELMDSVRRLNYPDCPDDVCIRLAICKDIQDVLTSLFCDDKKSLKEIDESMLETVIEYAGQLTDIGLHILDVNIIDDIGSLILTVENVKCLM